MSKNILGVALAGGGACGRTKWADLSVEWVFAGRGSGATSGAAPSVE